MASHRAARKQASFKIEGDDNALGFHNDHECSANGLRNL